MADTGGLALLTAETGDTTEFTDITLEGTNTLTATSGSKKYGNYGFDFYIDGTAGNERCYGNKALSSTATELYIRWYIYFPSGGGYDDEETYFVVGAIDATPHYIAECQFQYEATGAGFVVVCQALNDSAGYNVAVAESASVIIALDQWYRFEMYIKCSTGPGNNDGVLQLWQDGVSLGSATGLDNDTYTITRMRIGNRTDVPTSASHIYLDAVKADTSAIGAYVEGGVSIPIVMQYYQKLMAGG